MAALIYSGITSLDGYTADAGGNFDWSAPDAEVHAFVNDLERDIGTYLYGRRMYEVMCVWETIALEGQSAVLTDFARIWRSADKVVYSGTLNAAPTSRTRIERHFDPATVAQLKSESTRDLSIGGPGLASTALRSGLVDEIQQFVVPVLVGGGTRFLPEGIRQELELVHERRFRSGVVYLNYAYRK